MRRGSIFWGIVFVLVGLVLLLDQTGLFGNLQIWSLIGPLFLIFLGVWIVLGMLFRPKQEVVNEVVPLEGASSAQVRLNHGAGRMEVSSGAGAGSLLEGEFGGGVNKKVWQEAGQLRVSLSMPDQFFFGTWSWGSRGLEWKLRLNPEVKQELEINTGASELIANLEDLNISRLVLKTGASSTDMVLPKNAGLTSVRIESGAASVSLRVPAGVAAKVRAHGGLASISVDRSRFPRQGAEYCSPDFETALNKVEISIDTGVGSVDVR